MLPKILLCLDLVNFLWRYYFHMHVIIFLILVDISQIVPGVNYSSKTFNSMVSL
jgi:hypothetical protein